MAPKPKERVFLSYAHENLDMVRDIYSGLKKRNLDVWFDKEDLGPGRWKRKIEKAIPKSRYFIICISEAALKKTGDESPGFQDDELQQAYEIARDQPENVFTIVPVRLEDCGRGDHRITPWQQYDLFNDFEAELDHLAVNLGGVSLSDKFAEDTRTEDEKIIESLIGRGKTYFYAGEITKALETFEYIITLNHDHAEAWNNKGVALSALGREDEALSSFDKAREIKPDQAQAWYNMGIMLSDFGREDEAVEAYDKALEIKPDHADALSNKGIALFALGRNDEAIEAYEKALEINPEYVEAWYNQGIALSNLGREDEAMAAYDMALKIKPDHAGAWNNKGIALFDLGRNDEAITAYDKALEIKPDHSEALANKGVVLSALGRNDEAIDAYEKALSIFEEIKSPHVDLVREALTKLTTGNESK